MNFTGLLIFIFLLITGCTQQPRMDAWEHLQNALELDEASVLEYMALEHLPEIVAYDYSAALYEAVHADPDAAVEWILQNYRERAIQHITSDLPPEFIPVIIDNYGDILLDRLYNANPALISEAAAQYDPYFTFDKIYQRDPAGIIRRAIDQDPRYAVRYIQNYYNELE